MSIHHRHGWYLAVLLAVSGNAAALCPLTGFYRYVGDTATDNQCTDNDIQSAINNASATCRTNIVVTRERNYTQQAFEISGKTISLQGVGEGVACGNPPGACDLNVGCASPGNAPPPPAVTLSGNGSASVIYIHGNSNVTLQSVTLSGGGGIDYGGGVHFTGTGALTLVDSTVANNSASYGGGIQFNGSGGNASLILGAGAIIEANTASTDGGGIQLNGTARLFALEPYTEVGFNHAPAGHGGGIAVVGPARADIGSPGYNGLAAVYGNDAANGGGIAVIDDGHGEAVLREFGYDPSNPTAVDSNLATSNGGGIFSSGQADVCLFAPHLADNVAEDGAALYYDASLPGSTDAATSAGIYINTGSPARLGADCGPELVSDLGGTKDCRRYDPECNAFVGSATQHADATPAPGGVISLYFGGEIVATRFRIRDSKAGFAIFTDAGQQLAASRCELTDNLASTNLVQASAVLAQFHSCTVSNNSIGNSFVFELGYASSVDLAFDIVDQPGKYTVNWGNLFKGTFNVDYVLTNDLAGLPSGNPTDVQGAPVFVNSANGDYHLAPVAQIALDFGGATDTVDLDGAPAPVDLPGIPNFLGPADLGAYERQNLFYNCGASDSMFCDGFDH
jgi:hypothetical protein